MSALAAIAGILGAVILMFMLHIIFVWTPVMMYAESQCLKNGYPKAHVTVGLERYCSNLDGSVTVRVDKQ